VVSEGAERPQVEAVTWPKTITRCVSAPSLRNHTSVVSEGAERPQVEAVTWPKTITRCVSAPSEIYLSHSTKTTEKQHLMRNSQN
jgi:hypothetical protein